MLTISQSRSKKDKGISIAIISSSVGKTPEDIHYSFIFDEAYRLACSGVKVHVVRSIFEKDELSYGIHFHGLKRKIEPRACIHLFNNISVYPLISLLRMPTLLYWENLYALSVSEVVEEHGIDLIHAHFAYPEGLVGLLVKRRTKKPLIITVHGYDILNEPSVKYGVRLSKRIDAIIRRVLDNADAIITASSATFNEARRLVNKGDKVHLIPNGVDIQKFNPQVSGLDLKRRLKIEDYFVVFTLRRHEPKYGLEYLIKAIPIVLKYRDNVIFVIGG
ncbi:MAG: glycosyltransferase, partial [Thermoprotei archaeon]